MNRIKIVNILTTIQDGGMETLVYNIYKGLDNSKYDLYICSLIKLYDNFLLRKFNDINVNVKGFDFINKRLKPLDYFKNVIEIIKLYRYFLKNRFDIVHAHDFFSGTLVRFTVILLSFFYRPKKLYLTIHNLLFWLKPIHRRINGFLSVFTSKIICVSKSVLRDLLQKEKISREKFKVIYNGMNPENFYSDEKLRKNMRKELGYKETDFVIGNVGALSVRKGQIYILKALNNLKQSFPNLKVLLVGTPKIHELNIYQEIIDFIDKNNLSDFVKILDTTSKINDIYNSLDIFVMSSVTEGFSLAALEAMLTERICIFSDIPPFKELVIDNDNGYLFRTKDVSALVNKLELVINKKNDLKFVSVRARTSVIEKFSYENMILQYEKLYSI